MKSTQIPSKIPYKIRSYSCRQTFVDKEKEKTTIAFNIFPISLRKGEGNATIIQNFSKIFEKKDNNKVMHLIINKNSKKR